MTARHDVAAIGNAIVDVIAPCDDAFLAAQGLAKASMALVDEERSAALYRRMARGVETSGGSAANTIAGLSSFGGRGLFIGKVADDALGRTYRDDLEAIGAQFRGAPLVGGPGTGLSLINVTPDGERSMSTFLGAANRLGPDDIVREDVEGARILYLEGYLFDPPEARRAFAKAAALARGAGRRIALTLSDGFVVERHREALIGFIDAQVDILFANEAEVLALFGAASFDEAVRAMTGRIEIAALTRGARGSVILAGGRRIAVAAEPVETVVDTTGAGDQYAAGFLFGVARGLPLETCGRLGSVAAAEVISHFGPRPATPLADLAAARGLAA
ncbi:MAG: adenosine kinase [Caulobacteraceae bacterium]|nr:adenosine kinase [Caulobacteraceae bacterium]